MVCDSLEGVDLCEFREVFTLTHSDSGLTKESSEENPRGLTQLFSLLGRGILV